MRADKKLGAPYEVVGWIRAKQHSSPPICARKNLSPQTKAECIPAEANADRHASQLEKCTAKSPLISHGLADEYGMVKDIETNRAVGWPNEAQL